VTKAGGPDRLRQFADILRTLEPFDVPTLLTAFMDFAKSQGIKPKDWDGAVRVAVTGETVGFGLPETLMLLGRDTVLDRLEKARQLIAST